MEKNKEFDASTVRGPSTGRSLLEPNSLQATRFRLELRETGKKSPQKPAVWTEKSRYIPPNSPLTFKFTDLMVMHTLRRAEAGPFITPAGKVEDGGGAAGRLSVDSATLINVI